MRIISLKRNNFSLMFTMIHKIDNFEHELDLHPDGGYEYG
jgi:hypothetical protein